MPQIVRLGADHASSVQAIWNREILEGYAHFGEEALSIDEVRDMILGGDKRYPAFAAIGIDGAFMGFAKSGAHRTRSGYRFTAETSVYVEPTFQGQGVGKMLLGAVLDELRAGGFHTVLNGIALPNEASVRLHESLGFTRIGTLPEVGFKQGRWIDVGYWALIFS